MGSLRYLWQQRSDQSPHASCWANLLLILQGISCGFIVHLSFFEIIDHSLYIWNNRANKIVTKRLAAHGKQQTEGVKVLLPLSADRALLWMSCCSDGAPRQPTITCRLTCSASGGIMRLCWQTRAWRMLQEGGKTLNMLQACWTHADVGAFV